MINEAFVYRWRREDGSWYIGYHKGTANDGYICSSKYAKPDIQANPEKWQRRILRYGSKKEMMALERRLLTRLDARNNPKSFNRSNGYPPYDPLGVKPAYQRNRQPIELNLVGYEPQTYSMSKALDEAFRRQTGQPFEYHYLVSFFSAVKNNDTTMIKDMIPGIEKLFGFKLELNYV